MHYVVTIYTSGTEFFERFPLKAEGAMRETVARYRSYFSCDDELYVCAHIVGRGWTVIPVQL